LIRLVEPIEHVRQMFRGNADTVVGDCDLHATVFTSGIEAHRATRGRVTQRIGGEILQRLLEAMRIADHADIVMGIGDDLDLLLLR